MSLLGFEIVPFLAVQRDIEAADLLIFRNAQADEEIGHFQNDERADDCEDPRDCDSDELIQDLMRVAIKEAHIQCIALGIFEDSVHEFCREETGEKRADCAAGAVDAEGVERIIVAEDRFHFR